MSYDYDHKSTMVATLPAEPTRNGRWQDKKEQTRAYKVLAIWEDPSKGTIVREPVTVRQWMSRSPSASVCYTAIWVHGTMQMEASGSGRAGGWGYHRPSASLQSAIDNAGIALTADGQTQRIDGVGDGAMERALVAIARAACPEAATFHIVQL